ncbi:hypothetical protein Kpol_543p43 [Vanderwaltozyma polyspora DSM 70294]|uniref:STAS domain-containing protein n=1 Tax=Vanderwaltozyma polyspora (strain ATCC 22028 / DSM 70294 / BCRC 21397 / CBS 2163 / NBRC 10782 / NRRL Y-8283 / UCD 57-17) TaxID=436907 RepID=A7THP7_VANPO|nr:uncharacterized protein Kpol_543p43 [Vanderwaltozyma polyspora DSM 70294]EDO18213.1 hypothetical protein Kpol_543p43 [Vanderwaltozyma polyspora DSM 70294]
MSFDLDDLEDLELEYNQYKTVEEQGNSDVGDSSGNDDLGNAGDGLTKDSKFVFEKDLGYTDDSNELTRESFLNSSENVPRYIEETVTLKEYYNHSIRHYLTFKSFGNYLISIFPIIKWLPFYNYKWLISDLIAGITIGCVLVPQSMSYAQIATLPPQYGLYSSFVGAYTYSLFATSKDVCIGPVAVMSLQTAKVIQHVNSSLTEEQKTYITAPLIATTLALLCGIISAGVGLLRLGFLVELISLNAVTGFMTGSALNIISGQVPALMGYASEVNTREATYKVIINTLKHLPDTKIDAIFGLIPLVILYFWKWWFSSMGPKLVDRYYPNSKYKKYIKAFYFYGNAMRSGIIIIVMTSISWSVTRGKSKSERPISILGTVPSGLQEVGVFTPPNGLLAKVAPELPSSIIVLLLEHIAIAKSFGRVNDYKVVPDQELIAIGISNLIGTFFNSYPVTGSFSRSALKAKCNVKTPLSGIFTGSCVLLALYCLTGAFFYIPKATLSAVIIHAVSDLVASYKTTWSFWKMNPLDFICFITTVFITVFASIEDGIYFTMCWSAAILLFKVAFPAGKFLGYVKIAEIVNPEIVDSDYLVEKAETSVQYSTVLMNPEKGELSYLSSKSSESQLKYHIKWIPYDHAYTKEMNPNVEVTPPPDGVIVYRLTESFTYINCSRNYETLYDKVKELTRPGQLMTHIKKSDRPWNDPGDWKPPKFLKNIINWRKNKNKDDEPTTFDNKVVDTRPILKIICLDFSQVAQTDSTALQSLLDLRRAINKYADRQVEFHFSGILSPWVKKGLVNLGFGTVNKEYSDESIIIGHTSYHVVKTEDLENNPMTTVEEPNQNSSYYIHAGTGTNFPFFHIEIPDFSKWNI